jgi:hypothetical protein
MSTRGAYGFHKDGETKVTYNHSDSYPSGLGSKVIKFVRATPVEKLKEIYDQIVLVNSDSTPTEEQIKKAEKYFNDQVGQNVKTDWYSLLRKSQGDLFAYKEGLTFMIDGVSFLQDSLFCEWAYIINLDDEVLEVYKNCHLYQTIPLDLVSHKGTNELEGV